MDRRDLNLEWLLKPVSVEQFLTDYWEREPLVINRDEAGFFNEILNYDQLPSVLEATSLASPNVRLVKQGVQIPQQELRTNVLVTPDIMLEALYDEYSKGATVIIQALHERYQPLKELCRALSVQLSASLQANIYMTPANASGFDAHIDDHDVFVVQISGQKKWTVFDEPIEFLPVQGEGGKREVAADQSKTTFELRQGDACYIPRGWLHAAETGESPSVHVTIGVHTLTWQYVISQAVLAHASKPAYRKSLPPGFARDTTTREKAVAELSRLLETVLASADPEQLVDEATAIVERCQESPCPRRLPHIDASERISGNTMFYRRPGLNAKLGTAGQSVAVRFLGKEIVFPSKVEDDIRYLFERKGKFSVSELPGELDLDGRHVLVARLLKEGFLCVERA